MNKQPDILCIGSVLWDVIGRSPIKMHLGADVPGRITRLPGGVAMNIAMTLAKFGMTPSLLTALGDDDEGRELRMICTRLGIETKDVHCDPDLPTDIYMAIESDGNLQGAIADAHSLEAAGDAILTPLEDGRYGDAEEPYDGIIALDGNLTEALLADIAKRPSFRDADLRVAPASPGKATRLRPIMTHPGVTLYVNLEEAGLITDSNPETAIDGAKALMDAGAVRVLVTDGANGAAEGFQGAVHHAPARQVVVARITGAGDTFMAAHIAAEAAGAPATEALQTALQTAADYISEDKNDV